MLKENQRGCPDCDGPDMGSLSFAKGDGRCKNCHGSGEVKDVGDAIVEIFTLDQVHPDITCKICSGTGQCQTCGGTGYAYIKEKENANLYQKQIVEERGTFTTPQSSSSDESGCATVIAWLVGIVVVVVVAIWLAVNVVLPVVLLNSALALAILALVFKKQKTLFAILAILGGVYMLLDITNGWFSLNFVTKVVKNPNWISAFVYINAASIGFCIWLLIQPIWSNTKITETTSKRKSLLSRGGLVLLITAVTLSIPIAYYSIHNPFVAETLNLKFGHKANVAPIISSNVQQQASTPAVNENKNEQNKTGNKASSFESNKVIKSVKIGNQTWMLENLKTNKLNDGTDISLVTDQNQWAATVSASYCWYNNDEDDYKNMYGALYNWYAVNTGKLCPVGWHVPTDAEWTTLTTYLGGKTVAHGKLKELGFTHWQNPNIEANNTSGYTALPGGFRNYDGAFYSIGEGGFWWSSTESNQAKAMNRSLYHNISYVGINNPNMKNGCSVRCLKDNLTENLSSTDKNVAPPPPPLSDPTDPNTPYVVVEQMPQYPGGDLEMLNFIKTNMKYPEAARAEKIEGRVIVRFAVNVEGKVENFAVLKSVHPLLDAEAIRIVSKLSGFKPGLQGGKAVNVWYMAPVDFNLSTQEQLTGNQSNEKIDNKPENIKETSKGIFGSSVVDIEGNSYKTVTIGTQIWMVENLNTTKYNDGTDIPLVTDGARWASCSTPSYCWYNNDKATYKDIYGALYNWYSINTGKLCPIGWHLPSDTEWNSLMVYVGGLYVAGSKLKEKGLDHWHRPNLDATNEFGFRGLPGGARFFGDGRFYSIGTSGFWWTSTEHNIKNSLVRFMGSDNDFGLRSESIEKGYGCSVRCLKNN